MFFINVMFQTKRIFELHDVIKRFLLKRHLKFSTRRITIYNSASSFQFCSSRNRQFSNIARDIRPTLIFKAKDSADNETIAFAILLQTFSSGSICLRQTIPLNQLIHRELELLYYNGHETSLRKVAAKQSTQLRIYGQVRQRDVCEPVSRASNSPWISEQT